MTDSSDKTQKIEELVGNLTPEQMDGPEAKKPKPGPSFALKLSAAMRAVGSIDMDKENKHGRYKYVSEVAVKRAANKALHANGLTILSSDVVLVDKWEVPGKNEGSTVTHMICKATVTIGDDGFKTATFSGMGQGSGYDDKVLMKSQSTAVREMWKVGLCISQGHDPEDDPKTDEDAEEARKPQPRVKGMQPEQLEDIKRLFVSLDKSPDVQGAYCVSVMGHGSQSLTQESASRFIAHMEKELGQKDGAS